MPLICGRRVRSYIVGIPPTLPLLPGFRKLPVLLSLTLSFPRYFLELWIGSDWFRYIGKNKCSVSVTENGAHVFDTVLSFRCIGYSSIRSLYYYYSCRVRSTRLRSVLTLCMTNNLWAIISSCIHEKNDWNDLNKESAFLDERGVCRVYIHAFHTLV